jgi:ABC-2 type transport system ATP-binding protein
MENAMELKIEALTKVYGKKNTALDGVSLRLGNGMFGLLGPNGAGKTTLMKILATLLEPTAGTVTYNDLRMDRDPQAIRRILGYLPQSYGFYPSLSAREVLNYFSDLHSLSNGSGRKNQIDVLLEQVNLLDVADRKVGGFSGGMRQRLGIAQALLNDPALLIVDEPTAGLDPEERIRFRNLLGRLSGDRIVILSTHIVGDISSSCDDMALLDEGQMRFRGRPADLIAKADGQVWQMVVSPSQVSVLEERYQVVSAVRRAEGVELRILGDAASLNGLPNLASASPTLEDAYILKMNIKNSPEAAHV